MKNKILVLLIAFFLIFIPSAKAYETVNEETNFKLLIEDDADLLNDSEESLLKETMEPLTKYGNIAFKTIDSNNTSTSSYARSYYHNTFGTQSGSLFLIDMDNRVIYIFSDGSNYRTITSSKANLITDNIYKLATRGNYYLCADRAYSQMLDLLEGRKISEKMRYISDIIIAIIFSFLISFIYVSGKTKISEATYKDIIKNCDVEFEVNNIVGKKTGTHRVYSPQSDSSSGGGGGGGGSSGGGGGHSF